ncbi:dTDP-4-amino-4,6-dideoxygalactose transaminase [Actinocorallia herbida]|uniref:dTDP-4-amino-4,6-dideoxygalactose transaminase n=1 Tax=Actinocorallia herbida TaxID=58109 RepID=A0A3N1CZL0_9ACTN|nr:DegT/DnrJ/EryC1/StrS family aminotransferase [Actinocorallia herbida]ROO86721.1 dTDP-4-amino-4,6-dideoxygalactose transaminase [Actinocorallia herbida]
MPSSEHPGAVELARRFGQPDVVFTASGSAALEVAFEVLGVGAGDEVVVPDLGCPSIAAAVVRRGAVPVFVGVGPALTLSPDDVAAALSARTRAVVAAHHYGLPCDVRGIVDTLPPGITVIEDVAQTWGTLARGRISGSVGTLAVTSFGSSKPVSLGGGGALLGPPGVLRGAVSHGDVRDRRSPRPSSPARLPVRLLDDLPAAIAAADRRLAARRAAVAAFLDSDLSAHFRLPPRPPDSSAGWTRVPLYPVGPGSAAQVPRLRRTLGGVQPMHPVPPSGLPMFQDFAKRVVRGPGRPADPFLVKIG